MHIEEYLMNMGWVCVKGIDYKSILKMVGLCKKEILPVNEGFDYLQNSFDSKVFGFFEINGWSIIIGKYFFLDNQRLLSITNELSEHSEIVCSFAIDAWSDFYVYTKSIQGETVRFWQVKDGDEVSIGAITKEEELTKETELANKVLEIAAFMTVPFESLNKHLEEGEMIVLR